MNELVTRCEFRWNWWTLVPLALACAAIFAPFLLFHGFPIIGLALERGFALVCHQRPERSLWIFGNSVAICSRCLGIYFGAAVGLLFRTTRAVAVRLLIAAAVLNFLDVCSEVAGMHENWVTVRSALGLALGASAALLISSSLLAGCRPAASLRDSG
jgi:uncharacterized membrane protein